jgi:hypothetical protein
VDGAVRAAAAADQAQRGEIRRVEPEGVAVAGDVAERDVLRGARRRGRQMAVEPRDDPRRRRRRIGLQQRPRPELPAQPVLGALDGSRRRRCRRRAIQRGRRRVGGLGGSGEQYRGERSRGCTGEYGGETQCPQGGTWDDLGAAERDPAED